MKKYIKEIIILIIQILIFYLLPLTAGPTDGMGLVVLIIILTLIISLVLGIISNHNIKYLFPLLIAIIFIPSVFIYYNESALVHSIWYLLDSYIGLLNGSLINKIIKSKGE